MKSGSAPGLDGYTSDFFKENWPLLGGEFMEAVEYFLEQNFMYYPINAIDIFLIPKVDNLINLRQF